MGQCKTRIAFHIRYVLATQVKDQKTQRQFCRWFCSYNSTVVNYRWGYFSNLLVLLGTCECQKSNSRVKLLWKLAHESLKPHIMSIHTSTLGVDRDQPPKWYATLSSKIGGWIAFWLQGFCEVYNEEDLVVAQVKLDRVRDSVASMRHELEWVFSINLFKFGGSS